MKYCTAQDETGNEFVTQKVYLSTYANKASFTSEYNIFK